MYVSPTIEFVKKSLLNAEAGHDWLHTERVWKCAKKLAIEENAQLLVVELAALLHDIADSKFHHGDDSLGPKISRDFLEELQVAPEIIDQVVYIIAHLSYHNSFDQNTSIKPNLELQIVQDADRLDALGAIGIARAFHYGGFKNRGFYDPNIVPQQYQSASEYQKNQSPTINHFYEKLFLLKNKMQTPSAQKEAAIRHDFMCLFVDQFFKEIQVPPFDINS